MLCIAALSGNVTANAQEKNSNKVFHGKAAAYYENQATRMYQLADEALDRFVPEIGAPIERRLALGNLDMLLHDTSLDYCDAMRNFISTRLTKLIAELDNRFWQDEIYLSVANKFNLLKDWEANVSVDYQWNYLNSTLVNFAYPNRHTTLVALASAYTYRRFKAQASVLYTMVNERSTARSAGEVMARRSTWMHKFTPAVFFSYQPMEERDFYLRAFYKRIFRMPTFNDLYYTDIGNASLNPEYVDQYNIGFQWQTIRARGFYRGVRISADAYYNHVTDKIIAVPKGTGMYRWMMMNIGKVKIHGVDLTARTTLNFPADVMVDVSLNYTYQKAQDYTYPEDCGDGGTYK